MPTTSTTPATTAAPRGGMLTKRQVDAAQPRASRYYLREGVGREAVPGFACRVAPSGAKVFVLLYRPGGRETAETVHTIGEYGAFTVEQARDAARAVRRDVLASRTDPARAPRAQKAAARAQLRAERQAATVAELADLFLADRARQGKKAKTLGEYARLCGVTRVQLGPHAGAERPGIIRRALGAKKVADVTRKDVQALHHSLAGTPATANAVLVLLSAIFTFAEVEELRAPGTNPCRAVKPYPRAIRRRSLNDAGYTALGAALATAARDGLPVAPERQGRARGMSKARRAKLTGRTRGPYRRDAERPTAGAQNPVHLAALRFLALTGWRSGEVKGLRWDALDRKHAVAILDDTKTGRSVRPLGRAAWAVLDAAAEWRAAGHTYVFPSTTKPGAPVTELDHTWAAVRHAAGLTLTAHGLRHSFTTTARGLGYGDHVIAKLVGHLLNDTQTSRYGDVPDRLVRDAADHVAATIAGLLDPAPAGADVLPFRAPQAGAA